MIDQIAAGRVQMAEHEDQTARYRHLLREQLNQEGRKLLLRIIDEKDLRAERVAYQNYRQGFRDGLELAVELLWKTQ
ncbi:hypothetical protein H8711_02860 [Clostridiaceae bacterium NSJ-31]|uniref:Uncharacterized protein n=1 Tax=Ligaoa zhengdingensis TaxID=2763658 RepID=A0A926DZ58_9FIRM|nr:DUF6809 family protein [Ligaoa zhengdingensis]MBC8545880.1 hypothetical protein [Ligaoa zhengdingensis]